jgi:predicted MPP superfamily phosphohydrolase
MATTRAKKKQSTVRTRTKKRKVLVRIKKLQDKLPIDVVIGTHDFWTRIAQDLKDNELEIALSFLSDPADGRSSMRSLFIAREVFENTLMERSIGLSS